MLNRRTPAIAIPILLAALLAAAEATAQQPSPSDSPTAAPCVGRGAIVDGERQPPTPAEVKARQTSPACRDEVKGAPMVDFSPRVGNRLDKIYDKLQRIERNEHDDGGAASE